MWRGQPVGDIFFRVRVPEPFWLIWGLKGARGKCVWKKYHLKTSYEMTFLQDSLLNLGLWRIPSLILSCISNYWLYISLGFKYIQYDVDNLLSEVSVSKAAKGQHFCKLRFPSDLSECIENHPEVRAFKRNVLAFLHLFLDLVIFNIKSITLM